MATIFPPREVMLAYATCKVVSAIAVYLGVYVGERELSERFVRRVYLQKKPAPGLGSIVTTAMLTHLLITGACLCAMFFTIFVRQGTRMDMATVGTWAAIDAIAFTVLGVTIGQAMASNVSDQAYFNYKLEGLRAIRAMRRMLERALVPLAAVPVAAIFVPASRAAFIGLALAKPFT